MILDKIMIVDDDPRVISSVKLVLNDYDIIAYQNGAEVIQYLRKPNEISLILLDVFMQGMDGLSVLNEIRKINKNIAVIIMTAFGSMDIALQALRNKADDFIEKPFNVVELREKIKTLLKEKSCFIPRKKTKDDKVERIKRFIEKNHTNASLNYIADEMCLSTKYLSRMFYQKNGAGFREYKIKVKMDMAKSLLRKSSLTIKEISNNLGYQNPESFMRIFKRRAKLTPTQYKKNFSQ